MNKEIEDDQKEDTGDTNIKRPEWMTSMPDSLISDFDKGTKARGFNQNELKRDKSWMETPADIEKQKIEAKRIKKIQQKTNEKLQAIGLPTIEAQKKQRMMDMTDIDQDKQDDHIGVRAKSLFEIHQEKLMNEYKAELKEWKRRKKNGEKVGPEPKYKGVKQNDGNVNFRGSMESYQDARNPTFTRSKLDSFVSGGSIDNY